MTTANEYRRSAEESLGWAENAKTAAETKAFLDTEQAWIKAAARMNGESVPEGMTPPRGDKSSH